MRCFLYKGSTQEKEKERRREKRTEKGTVHREWTGRVADIRKRFLKIKMQKILIIMFLCTWCCPTLAATSSIQNSVQSSAGMWDALSSEGKVKAVESVIEKFAGKGVIIRKDPKFYAEEVDSIRIEVPEQFMKPIGVLLRTLFIMYRDFDDGRVPDDVIREDLGEMLYQDYVASGKADAQEEYYQEWFKKNRD